MAQRWTLEVKVGAFIVAGLTLFVLFMFMIGDFSTLFRPGYQLRVLFPTANGITEGSPVQYAGVEVGKVQGVAVVYPDGSSVPQVELRVKIPSDIQVRSDDEAAISTFGLLGEKYLEISPGPGQGEPLSPDGRLSGKPPVSTEDVIERSSDVLHELKQTLQGINNLVGSPEARVFLQETLQEGRDATRQWRVLGERLNMAMLYAESGEGNLGKLLYDDDLYQRMELFVEDLREHPWKLIVRPKSKKPKTDVQ